MTDGSATGGAMPSTPTGATATEEKKAAHPADQVPEDSTTHARAGRAGEATGTIHG